MRAADSPVGSTSVINESSRFSGGQQGLVPRQMNWSRTFSGGQFIWNPLSEPNTARDTGMLSVSSWGISPASGSIISRRLWRRTLPVPYCVMDTGINSIVPESPAGNVSVINTAIL